MTVLLIGCGRMGGAMARAWTASHRVLVHDPNAETPAGAERVETPDPGSLPDDLTIVLAVKPQLFPAIAPGLKPLVGRGPFLSIMAGLSLARLAALLGGTRRIVRAMPNTPAAIGKGITAAVGDIGVSPEDCSIIDMMLRATGEVAWLDREAELDAVTAVSGSGPAYFFRFTEALAKAGVEAGLSPDRAMQFARATFTGSAALAETRGEPLAELRNEVTSPGGTTAAGVQAMETNGAIDKLVADIVARAVARSRELAG